MSLRKHLVITVRKQRYVKIFHETTELDPTEMLIFTKCTQRK